MNISAMPSLTGYLTRSGEGITITRSLTMEIMGSSLSTSEFESKTS
ncbi:hypothetical protein [Methanosarcina mazei]|nr:hypothetical protein [Methanosarcina mazei]